MATFTLAKLISDWELLDAALQPHLTDMPYLKDKVTELQGLITEAKGMDTVVAVFQRREADPGLLALCLSHVTHLRDARLSRALRAFVGADVPPVLLGPVRTAASTFSTSQRRLKLIA